MPFISRRMDSRGISDEAELRAFATPAAERSHDPAGPGRQLAAARGAPDRRAALRALTVPTLVIHGAEDRLIRPACGEDIARNVAGAWRLIVGGMGHDLPAPLFELFVATIKGNSARDGVTRIALALSDGTGPRCLACGERTATLRE